MARKIILRPQASKDIDDHFEYIAHEDSDTALRFFAAVRQSIAQLARMPGMGTSYPAAQCP
ncbi:MAG: type II toxin-antitoxin system RelE/ParE family toxin [Synechococcales cyanobacterium RM1_1_8]|nr:type II toxin-antitoxin system RelE/ParE family toxin [Synechococcales cyanobacterium RM1_1_8]